MTDTVNTRRVEVLRDGEWIECGMLELQVGETFRMFDNDEIVVNHSTNKTEFVVAELPFTDTSGVQGVRIENPELAEPCVEGWTQVDDNNWTHVDGSTIQARHPGFLLHSVDPEIDDVMFSDLNTAMTVCM